MELQKKPLSALKDGLKFLTSNYKIAIGFTMFIILIIIALLQPLINFYLIGEHDPQETALFPKLLRASSEHPLGTDLFGRDILAMMILALRHSLLIGLVSGLLATLIAIIFSLFSGFKGGLIESGLSTFTNIVLVIPLLPLVMSIVAFARVDVYTLILIIGVFSWPWAARCIRAQVLSLKERGYVALAKLSGLRDTEIIFKEIFPNLLPYVAVGFTNAVMSALFVETSLRLIGLGPARVPTLGLMTYWSMTWGYLGTGKYLTILTPIILLVMLFASLNLMNVGLDDKFNPRLRIVTGR